MSDLPIRPRRPTPEEREEEIDKAMAATVAHCIERFVLWLFKYQTQWQWRRKLEGGVWEEWWVDSGVNSYCWMQFDSRKEPGKRPGGCAIWDRDPKPRNREVYL